MNIPFSARLARKDTGEVYPGDFEARPDLASAAIVAHEKFGATHRILTFYPQGNYHRQNWPSNPMAALAAEPEAR